MCWLHWRQRGHGEQGILMYPLEYLNKINCSGLPLAKLALKVGCPVMVLRNINPGDGVCNGSRGILTRATPRVLEVQLLSGEHAGELIFIPQAGIIPNETQVPFKLKCLQFPIWLCFANYQQVTRAIYKLSGDRCQICSVHTWAVLCCDFTSNFCSQHQNNIGWSTSGSCNKKTIYPEDFFIFIQLWLPMMYMYVH